MTEDPPRSKSVVMTVFGDAVLPHGGSAWLGSLIDLLAPFGINDRLVRTSVYRLAEEGWLEASRNGRRSLYRMTPSGRRRIERADQRIYSQPAPEWDGRWTLVLSAPEIISAGQRAALRKELLWEGFGTTAPGIFVHPTGKQAALEEILARVDVAGKVFVCSASQSEHIHSRSLSDLVAHCWPLDRIIAGYQQFIARFEPLRKLASRKSAPDPQLAFVVRTLLAHAYRRVQLHDPQLPLALLPASWPGTTAWQLSRDIYRLIHKEAGTFIIDTLRKEEPAVAAAAPSFYQRFGGLD